MRKPAARWCLRVLGVEYTRGNTYSYGKVAGAFHKLSLTQMWELYEQARANHRKLVKIHHPDIGGDATICGTINFCWKYLRGLFARFGVQG